ncbi:MAG TPA: efflux RND transporter periplasmic adaptor subunit [Steroidobacteraceae bacterium]|nr:efflux RND transporter periplasmic adaptor subunit [Steroidobacteraceae bacterium]
MRPFVALIAASLALVGLAGCGESPSEGTANPNLPPLQSIEVRPEATPLERQLDGTIEAVNQGTVAAQTAGRVTEILYDVNDFVPAGAVIVKLRATEQHSGLLQAEAALREATARETEAQTRYTRIADMYARKVVAKAMLDEATATRDAAVARLAAAKAAVDAAREGVAYTEVRAPYAGIVTKRHVEVGETVAPGTPIMSGLSLQYLRVVVDVPQSVVEQVRRIKQAAVYINGRRIEATRLTVFPEASTPSNTFRTRLDLPENAADLYPGMFVKVGFVVGTTDRLLVPQAAVVERSEVTGVYVVDAKGNSSLRQVRLGHRFGDRIEVLAGLHAGDRVATEPMLAMKRLAAAGAPDALHE